MKKALTEKFFKRPALKVAKSLLGKFLVRRLRVPKTKRTTRGLARNIALMITETEAYLGPQDKASHASRGPTSPAGKRTARNEPMWGEAGKFYVYFTYGMHWMLNIVTGREGYPAAVLIRACKIVAGKNINGPARLTKYLKVDKRFNNKSASRRTGLWIEDRGIKIKRSQINRRPRIGVDYAGKWAKKPYNFSVRG